MSFVLEVQLRIKPENVDRFMKQVLENAQHARKEPGCKQFDVLVDPHDRTQVMLYEVYANSEAFEAHWSRTNAFVSALGQEEALAPSTSSQDGCSLFPQGVQLDCMSAP